MTDEPLTDADRAMLEVLIDLQRGAIGNLTALYRIKEPVPNWRAKDMTRPDLRVEYRRLREAVEQEAFAVAYAGNVDAAQQKLDTAVNRLDAFMERLLALAAPVNPGLASRPSEPVPPEPRLSLKEAIEGLREMMTPEDHEKINAYLLESEAPCYCKRGVYTPSADCPRHMRPVPAPIGDDTRRLREIRGMILDPTVSIAEVLDHTDAATSGATEPNTTSEGDVR